MLTSAAQQAWAKSSVHRVLPLIALHCTRCGQALTVQCTDHDSRAACRQHLDELALSRPQLPHRAGVHVQEALQLLQVQQVLREQLQELCKVQLARPAATSVS